MFRDFLRNKYLKDCLHESGIHGLRLLLYCTPFKYARLIWSVFIFVIIISTHYIIATLIIAYIQQPTEVRMSTNSLHISNTNFPGVAVCSANKLNRTKVLEFAKEVFHKQQMYRPYLVAGTVEEMAQHLLILASFYVFAYDTKSFNTTVIGGLDEIFTFMFNSTNYPVRNFLTELAPNCNNLVVSGTVYGEAINTSEYFIKRMTSSSVCCLFNYNRKSYIIDVEQRYMENNFINRAEKIKFESSSFLNSIQFVLQSTPEDFTVTEFHTTAFQLYIFPPDDYATLQSNRFGEILVDYSTIVEIPIKPEFLTSSNRVRQFPPNVRNCYFRDEGQKLLNQSYYSLDECLLLCRMYSMLQHCGCVTPPMAATNKNVTYCNFADLPCLMKWKRIWYGWDDYEYVHKNGKDIKDDFTSSYRCPKCLPSCSGVEYFLEVNIKSLRSNFGPLYSYGILKGVNSEKTVAIVKLFFKHHYILSTEMDIVGDWVVLLNRFGGIMSLMYGFSIVSYIEILYFATGKFFILYFENWKSKLERKLRNIQRTLERDNNITKEENPPPHYSLYWNELQPQRLAGMKLYKNSLVTNLK